LLTKQTASTVSLISKKKDLDGTPIAKPASYFTVLKDNYERKNITLLVA
jgi:hypothetical protein